MKDKLREILKKDIAISCNGQTIFISGIDEAHSAILKLVEEEKKELKEAMLNEIGGTNEYAGKKIEELESQLAESKKALEAIKKHVELYLKGDVRLSTTWNIANQALAKLESKG